MKKIIIVEDEKELAVNIAELLDVLEYEVCGIFSDAKSCLAFLEKNKVDIALLDITINGNENGIQLAKQIKQIYSLPIVFCTAHAGQAILNEVSDCKPNGYVVKPFTLDVLRSTLFLALNTDIGISASENNNVFNVRDKGLVVPVDVDKIIMLKADGLYTSIITELKTFLIRGSLKSTITKLPKNFIRVHKSYVINKDYIVSYNSKMIRITNSSIPIGRGVHKELQKLC